MQLRYFGDCCISPLVASVCLSEPIWSRGVEQAGNEGDLASDAWLFVMDVTPLDSSDCLDPAQGSFGRS